MPILISVWGEPGGWREFLYLDEKEKVDEWNIRSISGLIKFKDILNESKLIVIVQDSILFRNIKTEPNYVVKEIYEKFRNELKKVQNYEEFVNLIKNYVLEIVRKILNLEEKIVKEKVDVIVVPSIGNFFGNLTGLFYLENESIEKKIDGNLIAGVLLVGLYRALKDSEDEEIILDITHGLNYFTILVFYVVNILASLLKKKIVTVNFVQIDENVYQKFRILKDSILSLNLSKREIEFKKMRSALSRIRNGKIIGIIKGVILSLSYNAVLSLLYFLSLYGKYCKDILDLLKYEEYVKLGRTQEEKYRIYYKREFSMIFCYEHVLKIIICDFLYRKLEKLFEKLENEKIEINLPIEKIGFSINVVRKFLEEIEHLLNKNSLIIIQNELSNIERFIRDNKSFPIDKEISLKEILSYLGEEHRISIDRTRTLRNFIAHAGFLKELVVIKLEKINDKELIILKYDLSKKENKKEFHEIFGIEEIE